MTIKNIKKRWIVLGLILLPFVPQMPGCIMASTPKFGRVIDVSTGKGMSNVTVIAAARFYAGPLIHGSSHDTLYRIITHTDANGNYWIPNSWLHTKFGVPGTEPKVTWIATAFQPGYAIVGDEQAWTFDQWGAAEYRPRSTEFSPSAWWLGLVVWVDPIKMYPAQLSLKEAAVYYTRLISVGRGLNLDDPEEVALRKKGYDIFLPQVCNLDPNETMDNTEAGSILSFVLDKKKSFERMKQLEPEMMGKEIYDRPQYKASNECEEMKAGEESS